jgi:hypothetical protein
MNVIIKEALAGLVSFFNDKSRRRLVFLIFLGLFAFINFLFLGLARRTFVFYAINSGMMNVEERMLKRSSSRELDIRRYVEEALLGPESPDLASLFPRGTGLLSLLYRDGVVYADFSEAAALPPLEGGDVFQNFSTLREGIRRNFSFVKDVRFFITGRAAYSEEFKRIFTDEKEK